MSYVVARGCTYCNTCLFECPSDAITMTNEGARIDPELCTECGTCVEQCASEAIVHESEVRREPNSAS